MKTIGEGKRWHLFAARDHSLWFGLSVKWDRYSGVVSVTVLTGQTGFEWVWRGSGFEKGERHLEWPRVPKT